MSLMRNSRALGATFRVILELKPFGISIRGPIGSEPWVGRNTGKMSGSYRVIKFGGKFKSRCNSECPCCKQRLLSQCLKRKGKMSSIYGMENWFWIEKGDKVFIQFEWRIGQNVSPCTIHSLHFTQILSNKSYAIYFFHRHILCSHWVGIRISPATIWYFEIVFRG